MGFGLQVRIKKDTNIYCTRLFGSHQFYRKNHETESQILGLKGPQISSGGENKETKKKKEVSSLFLFS